MDSYARLSIFKHLFAPLGATTLLFMLAYGTKLDFSLASSLFELQGNAWSLQHYWLTETLLHNYARTLNESLTIALLGLWIWRSVVLKDRSHKQRALGVLLLSLLCSFATVAILKRLIPMECPWDLQQFGGESAFWGLFDTRPATLASNQCFPAGHSSIGFAWLALYYYWRETKPHRALQGLFIGVSLGLLLGFVQQLRGAHFISHDIATATICWLVSTLLYIRLQRPGVYSARLTKVLPSQSQLPAISFISSRSTDV